MDELKSLLKGELRHPQREVHALIEKYAKDPPQKYWMVLPPVFIMDAGGDVSGSDGGASPCTTRAQNKEKRNEKKILRKRKKVVRLKSAGPSNKGKDVDFMQSSDDGIGDEAEKGQGCNRKRHRKQMHDPAPATAAGSAVPIDPKKRPVSIRCSLAKFLDIVKALDEPLKAEIPNSGGDPPFMKDDVAHVKRRELGVQVCGSSFDPKYGIHVSDILNGFKERTLTGDLRLRAFFMAAFQSLLFSNIDSYIRLEDVSFTEDLRNIGNRNWCKAVVDSLRKAAHLYKKDFPQKGINAPITSYGIFLMMLYVDNLQHGLDTKSFSLPRCAFLDTKTVEEISAKDLRRDLCSETIEFGNMKLRSISNTCYSLPATAVVPTAGCTAAPAPQVDHGRSDTTGTSAYAAGRSHDPGGHAPIFLQPPPVYPYPSFGASFGQSIADVVGRSRKSEAMRILKAFDDSTSEAQKFMAKAVEYTSRSQELMAKANNEFFSAMQKLLVDARADKIAANEARRSSRATNDDATKPHAAPSSPTTDPDKTPGPDDLHFESPSRSSSPIESLAPDNHEEIFRPESRSPPTPSALLGPSQGLDSMLITPLMRMKELTRNMMHPSQGHPQEQAHLMSMMMEMTNKIFEMQEEPQINDTDSGVVPDATNSGAPYKTATPDANNDMQEDHPDATKSGVPSQTVTPDGLAVHDDLPRTYIRRNTHSTMSSSDKEPDAAAGTGDQHLEVVGKNAEASKKVAAGKKKEPKSKAVALRNKIAADEKLKETTLIDYSTYISFDGSELITTFADDKYGHSSILDFTVHCLRYDCIVHKEDSIGYRAFLSTAFYIEKWSTPMINLLKQAGPSDCMFFLWKYMEFWDGERLHTDINPFKGMIYRVELMHYLMFHPLNQPDLPDELDFYRCGGRKVDWNSSQ
ncbi:uncharacterized protein C2845_PM05G22180 [Panicum miliaceum]|uniref:Ubiquitin-like protease family profile domain-containing protein n=1 Tax=Panicum miliaceum TaxID=4540 RepID=A0A3L6T3L7_PANMI|nr:uncharacterized protein C2845_PM05G22180 [Panicum miliaceum]